MRAADKQRFYKLVNESENDRLFNANYKSPYMNEDIDTILSNKTWSIEHVLPRSFINGSQAAGDAENDWLGWDVANRYANSARSNLPLVLWPDTTRPQGRCFTEDGEPHYNPPEASKARLARKWIFLRATYAFVDIIDPPSNAQKAHAEAIFENVANKPIGVAEAHFQTLLENSIENMFNSSWRNPLYTKDASTFLEDSAFMELVFNVAKLVRDKTL